MSKSRVIRPWGILVIGASFIGVTAAAAVPPDTNSRSEPSADLPEVVETEGQPIAANLIRLLAALEALGTPIDDETANAIRAAGRNRDAAEIQKLVDPRASLVVRINPESRVSTNRGPSRPRLQQAGFRPVLIKVINQSTATARLRMTSPQAGAVYAGAARFSLLRQQQPELNESENKEQATDRFLALELYSQPPMSDRLSGLEVEYLIGLIYSSESGRREATIGFDMGQAEQDLGARGSTAILWDIQPALRVPLRIVDFDGSPTTAHLLFRDRSGHVQPLQAKRLAPDLFFQPQIYRHDGESVLLPPGTYEVEFGRGPEYRLARKTLQLNSNERGIAPLEVRLERWIEPRLFGLYSGDHHIHAAGCAHYTVPTEGVSPEDMFRQVKGEALNVGCVLTWGPCYDHQRRYFSERPHDLSEPLTILKYDVEVSGFGSQALGHVCLLNLRDQTYPGSEGTATKGWPTWTTPVMRWAKEQGGITGYAHSASGMQIEPAAAARRIFERCDLNQDELLDADEWSGALLPELADRIDADRDRRINMQELVTSLDRAADQLPNLAIPEMNGVGAMEIFVSVCEEVCDFISAMDTRRIQEWNTWYHLLNCGFRLKVSGETDFPCMSSRRVGQGRVYVRMDEGESLDFSRWCGNLAAGKSYVSDGYAHAVDFRVNGSRAGEQDLRLMEPGRVTVTARVAFAAEMPRAIAQGTKAPAGGRRFVGDTVELYSPRDDRMIATGEREVELIMNGKVVGKKRVPADDAIHDLEWELNVERSSWIAVRHFPQLHTNPINVLIAEQPIRAARSSAVWCRDCLDLLWKNRQLSIAPDEREVAKAAFDRARELYTRIIDASSDDLATSVDKEKRP
ncbi:MAG: hypothetical protein FJ295_17780 [Planctomycetes bacterium]|nr:hypothetical protein [Planctomycetota bacterium]